MRRLRPYIISFILSRRFRAVRRARYMLRHMFSSAPHKVYFFHQMDDPYSHVVAQALPMLKARYQIDLQVIAVNAPDDDVAPERLALQNLSRRDAAKVAPYHGLSFNDIGKQPKETTLQLAKRAFAASGNLIKAAGAISDAFWKDDTMALERMALVSAQEATDVYARGTALRDKLGHYLGGMFYYDGEWYWGVDRLPYLEERLARQGARATGGKQLIHFQKRPDFMTQPAQRRLTVEFYPSARSPYSYLAMPETLDLPNQYPINLVVRPVLPMVMRGLPVPRRKGTYILGDSKREAERIGLGFGKMADPVGRPVRRGYSLFGMADKAGQGGAFLYAFCTLAWSKGVDMGSDEGLRRAVEEAGLDWQEALEHLDSKEWEADMEANRQQMVAAGLWGVPSYRLLDEQGNELFSTWGRDRIWLLAHEIQKALN